MRKQFLRFAGILLGLALLYYLLQKVGWTAIGKTFEALRWRYAIVMVYALSWYLSNSWGWAMSFEPRKSSLSYPRLFRIYFIGESFNSLLPSGYVGGEPLKVKLAAQGSDIPVAASSVLLAKAAQSLTMVPYLGISLYLGAGGQHKHELPHHLWLILVFLGLGILIFSILLAKGTFLKSLRFLESASGIQRLRRFESSFEELDASLGAMYRDFKGRYLGSLACFSFGWIAHAMEVALVFFLLGYSVSWRDALFISAMAQLGSLVALFIPAGLGVYEGGHYLAAMLLGLPTSLVLSVGLIRRLRQAFWDAAGLLLY